MDKIIEGLLKNTPLAVVLIGAFLMVIGASGGMEKFALKVPDSAARVALGVTGVVVAGFGGLLIWRGRKEADSNAPGPEEYDLKITAPLDGAVVDAHTSFAGSFKKKPPEGSIALIEQSTINGDYWFMRQPAVDEKSLQWFIESRVGGEPGEQRLIHLVILGQSGQALWEYYRRVGQETKRWPAIRMLTSDMVKCHSVKVRRK